MVNTKPILKKMWMDRLTVTEYRKVQRPNKSTGFEEVVVMVDEPCKLSFAALEQVDQQETAAAIAQVTKLFLDNLVKIKPGSKLTVRRAGETFEYSQSGLPGIFSGHQEIVLVPFKGFA